MDDPRARWSGTDGERLAADVIDALRRRTSPHRLGVGEFDGRVDLRGMRVVSKTSARDRIISGRTVQMTDGYVELRDVVLEDLDLSGGDLQHLRVLGGRIRNCLFESARLRDLRMWAVETQDSSFRAADLRNTVLGGWMAGKGCSYNKVSFVDADLRGMATPSTTFHQCNFTGAKLHKVEFDSDFLGCRFAGRMTEVIFHASLATGTKPHPNRLVDVDFSDAEWRWVEFRGFDMERVVFPVSPNHAVFESQFRCVLERALEILRDDDGDPSVRAVLTLVLKTMGPDQSRGALNLTDLQEVVSDGRTEPAHVLERAQRLCS